VYETSARISAITIKEFVNTLPQLARFRSTAWQCGADSCATERTPHFHAVLGLVYRADMVKKLTIETSGQGLHEITAEVVRTVKELGGSGVEGLCTLFIQHTSASLVIQENADPSARHDLENWLNRLVPEDDPHFTHKDEGPDDMPSHIKAALTATSLSIPIIDGQLALGRWQGIFLWEHRRKANQRRVVVHLA
jgi:secondary thiamine-phosphate synthase enzyme